MTNSPIAMIRSACIRANPNIPLRILVTDSRKPKIVVLSRAAIAAGLLPKKHREDGLLVGESKDKKCWRIRWYKKDGTLAQAETYSKNFIQIIDEENEATISLTDVLLAIQPKNFLFAVDVTGTFWELGDRKHLLSYAWNLREDSLESQSPECLAFLASLLGKE